MTTAQLSETVAWIDRPAYVDTMLYGIVRQSGDLDGIEPLAEIMADLETFEIGLQTGAHVHLPHSFQARGFDLAGTFRAIGMMATGEALIQCLCMTEDGLVRFAGRGKCPLFRTAAEVERMCERLPGGEVSNAGADLAPWSVDRKNSSGTFECGAGLIGLQSSPPPILALLEKRGLPPCLTAAYCAERPAQSHGSFPRKGSIRLGADADLLILERGQCRFGEADTQDRPEMRCSPCHGRDMRARVAGTVLRGRTIWNGASVPAKPGAGQHLRQSID